MVAETASGMVLGVQGEIIRVQADVSNGLPVFYMIGYLSNEAREAKDRVRTALKNIDIPIPPKRISVNFAPADLRKTGTFFDLAVAVALLLALELVSEERVRGTLFLGELSLDGRINPVPGVLSIVTQAARQGFSRCVVAMENTHEAALSQTIEVHGFHDLKEVLSWLKEGILPAQGQMGEEETGDSSARLPDLSEVCGQRMAKRAMEIAAAGNHYLFLDGPPGVGKSMLASCMPAILPAMRREEMLETTMVYSAKGLLKENFSLIQERPFRAPSAGISTVGMFGGGNRPKPGEISLAHHGVLFLDEFPEFSRELIEMFRVPMEQHYIQIVRGEQIFVFPADFLLIAAANPCPCGYYPNPDRCRCTPKQIRRYQNKLSGPILDRMDLFVRCEEVSYEVLTADRRGETSESVKRRVEAARKLQAARFEKEVFLTNSAMHKNSLERYCALSEEGERLMRSVFDAFHLSGRTYFKLLKIARTIADLDGEEQIKTGHLEEAVQFRSIQRTQ